MNEKEEKCHETSVLKSSVQHDRGKYIQAIVQAVAGVLNLIMLILFCENKDNPKATWRYF